MKDLIAQLLRDSLKRLADFPADQATVAALRMHTEDYDLLVSALKFAGCDHTPDIDLTTKDQKRLCGVKLLVSDNCLPGIIEALDRDGNMIQTMKGLV